MAEVENKPVSSNRQKAIERMKGKYPDRNFDDDEVFFGAINDDYDGVVAENNGYKEREKAFSDMFSSDPRSAAFLTNWRKGEDPAVQLVRQFGTEIKDAIDDPERQEQIAAANKEYVERVAKEKQLDEEYQSNLAASLQTLEAFQQKNGLTDEEIDQVMEFLVSIMKDGIMGKFSEESMQMARKAIMHDADVTTASEEGEVKGKNAKVEEKLRKQNKGDGTKQLDGQNNKGSQKRPTQSLGALDNYGDNNKTIWERGGEKRQRIRE